MPYIGTSVQGKQLTATTNGIIHRQQLIGDGILSTFALIVTPVSINATDVYINGVYQNKTSYTVIGSAITFSEPLPNLSVAEIKISDTTFAGGAPTGIVSNQRFSGNGSTVAFTLSSVPVSVNNVDVHIDSVYQQKNTYSVSGSTLTFSTAPIAGVNNVDVSVLSTIPIGVASADFINFTPSGTLSSTNVQSAITELVTDLAASSGSSMVGYLPAGIGAVGRTVQSKLRESVSVLDFGAVGDGVTDDTASFFAAQSAASFIYIPSGLNCLVTSGLDYWKFYGNGRVFENGVKWAIDASPQTDAIKKTYVSRTFGTYEQAVGGSITINTGLAQTKENTQVLGTDTLGLAQSYTDRDHVAQYIAAYSFTPDVLDSSTTYTATTITNSTISIINATGNIKPGMIIDTLHAIICTGRIKSILGNVITVDVWYPRNGGGATIPVNNIGAIINPNNKIFGQNIVVSAQGNGATTGAIKFSGVELDLFTPISSTPISGTWGYDMAVLGGGYIDLGYQIRGKRNISFFSNNAGGGGLYGFRSVGDLRGLSIEDSTNPIEVITNSQRVFGVGSDGLMSLLSGGIKFIGPIQTTGSFVNVGTNWDNGHGSLFYITGHNVNTGAEGKFLFAANITSTGPIYSSDGSGCTVEFQISVSVAGNYLQIRSTTGTFQYTSFQLIA